MLTSNGWRVILLVAMLLGTLWQPRPSPAMPITFDFEGSEYTVRMTFPSMQSPRVVQRDGTLGSVYTNTGVALFQQRKQIAQGAASNYSIFPKDVVTIIDGPNTITATVPSLYRLSPVMTCTLCGEPGTSFPITATVRLTDISGFMTQNSITATAFIDDMLRVVMVPALISNTALFMNAEGVIDIDFGTSVITDTIVAIVNRTANVVAEPVSLLLAAMGFAALGLGARWYGLRP